MSGATGARGSARRRLLPGAALLWLVAALAGAVAAGGAGLAVRGAAERARAPAAARLYAVALTRHVTDAAEEAGALPGVVSLRWGRLGEVLAERGAPRLDSDRLRVIALDVSLDAATPQESIGRLQAIPGVVEVIDGNAAERARFDRRRGALLLAVGGGLIAIAAAACALGAAGAARFAVRESGDEIALRYVLGAEPAGLWRPFAIGFGAAAVLAGCGAAALAVVASGLGSGVAPSGAVLASLAAGAAAWLAGTVAAAVLAARRQVLRVARSAIAVALAGFIALGVPGAARARGDAIEGDGRDEVARLARELRRVSRELAVARHARHRAALGVAAAELARVAGLVAGDAVTTRLARTGQQADARELERWRRRCAHLRERRSALRVRRHEARLGPPIEPRVMPVAAEVAVPFEGRDPAGSAAFRHGVGLRVKAGQTIVATAPGQVAYAGDLAGMGPVVVVDHGRRVYSVYGRIGVPLVELGEKVASGEPVARAPGRGGLLYFSVRQRGRAVDPLRWIRSSQSTSASPGTRG